MAEFSKQFLEFKNLGLRPDFDIIEKVEHLEPGYYVSQICEGYGFIAIGKDDDSNVILAFRADNDEIEWRPYSEVVKEK